MNTLIRDIDMSRMVKIDSHKLEGLALSYAVSMIEMPHLVWGKTIGVHHASFQIVIPELSEPYCYSPYLGWDMCGPIIEREKLSPMWSDLWGAWEIPNPCNAAGGICGSTFLIAAMRAYVIKKVGSYIKIPKELVNV